MLWRAPPLEGLPDRAATHAMAESATASPKRTIPTATLPCFTLRFRQNSLAAACLPDQRSKHHQNPYQRRVRFDPVGQRTLNGGTFKPSNEVAQAH